MDLHGTAFHHGEQIVGHRLGGLAAGDMGEQGLARHIQRLGRQHGRSERRHGPRGVAEAHQQAEAPQAGQRAFPGVLAHAVVDHFHTLAARDLLHALGEVLAAVVDGMGCTVGQGQRALLVRARSGDELQAQGPGPLAGDQAHATGRRMEQHGITRCQALDRNAFLEQVLGGQALEHHGGSRLERNGIGQAAHAHGGHDAHLAVAARRIAGIGHAVAHAQVLHAGPHGLDHACAFHAQAQGHGQRVQARALVHIDEVQAHRMVAYAYLAWPGLAHGDLHQLQDFGAAVVADLHCNTHGSTPAKSDKSGIVPCFGPPRGRRQRMLGAKSAQRL